MRRGSTPCDYRELTHRHIVGGSMRSGFVLLTIAVAAIAILGALGLAVDVGRVFIAKNETQAYCDSAALAAALTLDGTTTGISKAKTAVTNSANTWNLDSTIFSSPTVTFATSTAGPWSSSPNPATGYGYVKVSVTVSLNLYFIPMVAGQTTQSIVSSATAAQVSITSFNQGLSPYTAIGTTTVAPNFGLTVGHSYDIQWGQGANIQYCEGDSADGASNLFNQYWSSSTNGYWGANSNNIIEQEIVDLIQTQPITVGMNMAPDLTSGQKQSQSNYLDDRAGEDISTVYLDKNFDPTRSNSTNNAGAYLSSYSSGPHNARRLLPVPVALPSSTTISTVVGFGSFLLIEDSADNYYKSTTNGNAPYCAIYAGPYQVGGMGTGTGGSSGATYVKLVQ